MLSGAGFGDDARLLHAPRQQGLTDAVVDLVRTGMVQIFATRHASYDAKNRHGLSEEIDLGESPAEAWANFLADLKAGSAKVAS